MTIVCISDTHSKHDQVIVPPGDVLVHCGDFTEFGDRYEAEAFLAWFESHPHEHKIFTAGNRDFYADERAAEFQDLVHSARGVTYLCESGVTLAGLKFWGSPVTSSLGMFGGAIKQAFCRHQPDWSLVPSDTEILITHTPPDEKLSWKVESLDRLRLHCCGHVHGGYGKHGRFINASLIDERGVVANPPIVVKLQILVEGSEENH